ncbi:MAG: hypothetical protein LBB43_03520 [Spirochaetaceae bacterium]|jgi:hypothetical protein|nr:hypothetical protein [Spirochaetaceae bacterium]
MRSVVLIPHRNITPLMHEYRRRLFAAEVRGAWAFPLVAPIVLVTRAYSKSELQKLGQTIRALSCTNSRDGRIYATKTGYCSIDTGITLFGPVLEMPIVALDDFPAGTVARQFPAITLCTALSDVMSDPPPISPFFFRAASLANMIVSPLDCGVSGFSYQWKIGEQIWLPKGNL